MPSEESDLAPGPLSISPGLARVLAACALVRAELPERAAELTPDPRSFGLLELASVERSIEVTLPHDVIVVAGLRMPALVHASGIELEGFTGNHSTYDRPWVTIASAEFAGMDPELEWSPTDQGVHALDLCISSRQARSEEPKLRIHDEMEPETPRNKSLSSFLAERPAIRYPDHWPAAWRRAAKSAPPEHGVAITDDRPPALAIPVTHPKFGPGTIVKELDEGKVEVRFASGETKTMLRRFLA